jgi:hypothetical protein
MLHRVVLVRTDVSEELSACIIRVTRIGQLGTTLGITSKRRKLCSCRRQHAVHNSVKCLEATGHKHTSKVSFISNQN